MLEVWRRDGDHILYESNFGHILCVLCGSVAIYEICILLTENEAERWKKQGALCLQGLAKRVREDQGFTETRNIMRDLSWFFIKPES